MTEKIEISPKHPRAESLKIREKLVEQSRVGIVAEAGLISHGRGEAFDYLIGEKTMKTAVKAIKVAAAAMLLAKEPVISVNGNVASLVPEDIVKLADVTGAKVEVNLFYRIRGRDIAIKNILEAAGAKNVLGVGEAASAQITEINSERRRVDPNGILKADVILVPLEDGDRTMALRRMGKMIIAIDLNPLSRTAQCASITIVDNVVRTLPLLVKEAQALKMQKPNVLQKIVSSFDNKETLKVAIKTINKRLSNLSEKGIYIPEAKSIFLDCD
jgi:4-phosphopantoate--beta-alanine ligase